MKGVFPCYKNQFSVGTGAGDSFEPIAQMESYSVSVDNGTEEWKPYEQEGWTDRMKTAQSITITASGKRCVGDPGNDHIASLFMASGQDAECPFQWTFPDGAVLTMEKAVINVTNLNAGDSTGVGPLEFEVLSKGKPKFTEAEPTA